MFEVDHNVFFDQFIVNIQNIIFAHLFDWRDYRFYTAQLKFCRKNTTGRLKIDIDSCWSC